jgi:hypothetical protein
VSETFRPGKSYSPPDGSAFAAVLQKAVDSQAGVSAHCEILQILIAAICAAIDHDKHVIPRIERAGERSPKQGPGIVRGN